MNVLCILYNHIRKLQSDGLSSFYQGCNVHEHRIGKGVDIMFTLKDANIFTLENGMVHYVTINNDSLIYQYVKGGQIINNNLVHYICCETLMEPSRKHYSTIAMLDMWIYP